MSLTLTMMMKIKLGWNTREKIQPFHSVGVRIQWGISAESLDHNKPPPSLILKIELISFAVFTRDPVVKYILVRVLYIFRVVLKSFHPHKLPQEIAFFKLYVKQTTSKLNCWPEWSAEHKFWGNKNFGKFMTNKTSLYDIENV